jgi:KUP system potassium uptake protein
MDQSIKQESSRPTGKYLAGLSIAALGIVYGDIGTSPLYAMRECFSKTSGIQATPANIVGVLSLICWSLILVISVKYLIFILRADNNGEGGILALTALVTPLRASAAGGRAVIIILGLFGAALLYGDGMITPAISVLSAVEGLGVATPMFEPFIIPLTILILFGLFFFQHRGTAGIGAVFGPLTLIWFLTLAVLGIINLVKAPGVLVALNPYYAMHFFFQNGLKGFLVLGSVFLVVTGGEALYADMGHFGPRPIKLAWFTVAFVALLLNYFGQGALLLRNPGAVENPFYLLAPSWGLYPLVIIATVATVIASQAVISGAFSLTMQAVQLGYSPRLNIEHTSQTERGQIYLPFVNRTLMVCCIGLVLGFRSSGNLASAYGIAVASTMSITTLLFFVVARYNWKWSLWKSLSVCGAFMVFDISFFLANIVKVAHGGWFPLLVAALIFALMTTWKWGRAILAKRLMAGTIPVTDFLKNMQEYPPIRVPGTAVFMSGNIKGTPSALLHNLKHNHVLHEMVILVAVVTEEVPHVFDRDRITREKMADGFYRVTLHYGFMEDPNVPKALKLADLDGWTYNPLKTTFFLGRETLLTKENSEFWGIREQLFVLMSRNARNATDFFSLPPNRVVELGMQVRL